MRRLGYFVWIFSVYLFFSCNQDIQKFKGEEIKFIKIKKGKLFLIHLKENHLAGQTWALTSDFESASVNYIKSNYHGNIESTTDFIFEATQLGITKLRLNLIQYSNQIDSLEILVTVIQ